jgi:hypothetical protein
MLRGVGIAGGAIMRATQWLEVGASAAGIGPVVDEMLQQIIQLDQTRSLNCTSQDDGHDRPCARLARDIRGALYVHQIVGGDQSLSTPATENAIARAIRCTHGNGPWEASPSGARAVLPLFARALAAEASKP